MVHQACDICVYIGTQMPWKKLSISHVNYALITEIQADLVTMTIRRERHKVLNIVDTGTRYGERVISPNHRGETRMELLETEWFNHHGPPCAFIANPEF